MIKQCFPWAVFQQHYFSHAWDLEQHPTNPHITCFSRAILGTTPPFFSQKDLQQSPKGNNDKKQTQWFARVGNSLKLTAASNSNFKSPSGYIGIGKRRTWKTTDEPLTRSMRFACNYKHAKTSFCFLPNAVLPGFHYRPVYQKIR